MPETLIVKAVLEHGRDGIAGVAERVLERILTAEPRERIAFMQMGIPVMAPESGGPFYTYPCDIDEELMRRFADYLEEMNLNGQVLFAGALMVELGVSELPSDLPPFSHVCGDLDEID